MAASGSGQHTAPEDAERQSWNKERLVELDAELVALKLDYQGMKKKLSEEVKSLETKASSRNGLLPGYVFSGRAQVIHLNEETTICSPPFTWKTICGWRYGGANFTLQDGSMENVTCAKCKMIAQSRKGDGGDHRHKMSKAMNQQVLQNGTAGRRQELLRATTDMKSCAT